MELRGDVFLRRVVEPLPVDPDAAAFGAAQQRGGFLRDALDAERAGVAVQLVVGDELPLPGIGNLAADADQLAAGAVELGHLTILVAGEQILYRKANRIVKLAERAPRTVIRSQRARQRYRMGKA